MKGKLKDDDMVTVAVRINRRLIQANPQAAIEIAKQHVERLITQVAAG